jgi:hypothetical protein
MSEKLKTQPVVVETSGPKALGDEDGFGYWEDRLVANIEKEHGLLPDDEIGQIEIQEEYELIDLKVRQLHRRHEAGLA